MTLYIWLLFLILLMWSPLPPGGTAPIAGFDLIIHFGTFLVFGFLLWHRLRPDTNNFYWLDWFTTAIIFAFGIETGQFLVPGRSVQILDYGMNFTGTLAGGLLCFKGRPSLRWIAGGVIGFSTIVIGILGTLFNNNLFEVGLLLKKSLTNPIATSWIISAPLIVFIVYPFFISWETLDVIVFLSSIITWLILSVTTRWLLYPGSLLIMSLLVSVRQKNNNFMYALTLFIFYPVLLMVLLGAVLSPQFLLGHLGLLIVFTVSLSILINLLSVEHTSPYSTTYGSNVSGQS